MVEEVKCEVVKFKKLAPKKKSKAARTTKTKANTNTANNKGQKNG